MLANRMVDGDKINEEVCKEGLGALLQISAVCCDKE